MSERRWVSGHLGFRGGIYTRTCDEVLLSVVRPMMSDAVAAGLVVERFFIRYSEAGPHIRVRLLPPRRVSPLAVRDFVEYEIARHGVVVADEGARLPQKGLSWRWVRYVPETERYGGPWGVEVAERMSTHSSMAVLSWLAEMKADRSVTRPGLGLGAMLSALGAFFPERQAAVSLARTYSDACLAMYSNGVPALAEKWRHAFEDSFRKQADKFHEIVEAYWNGASIDRFDGYEDALREVRALLVRAVADGRIDRRGRVLSEYEALSLLVPSYIHMTSNRLGLSIADEAFLAYAIRRATADISRGRGR